jgi:hypothetical protein
VHAGSLSLMRPAADQRQADSAAAYDPGLLRGGCCCCAQPCVLPTLACCQGMAMERHTRLLTPVVALLADAAQAGLQRASRAAGGCVADMRTECVQVVQLLRADADACLDTSS